MRTIAITTKQINDQMDAAGYGNYTYAVIADLIYCKLKDSVQERIPIGPLAGLILE